MTRLPDAFDVLEQAKVIEQERMNRNETLPRIRLDVLPVSPVVNVEAPDPVVLADVGDMKLDDLLKPHTREQRDQRRPVLRRSPGRVLQIRSGIEDFSQFLGRERSTVGFGSALNLGNDERRIQRLGLMLAEK